MTRHTLKIAALSTHALLVLLLLAAGPARATTYYIDSATGSNANDGLAETTGGGHGPWKSHPYMARFPGCTGGVTTWPGWSDAAGAKYVFKGGSTWPADCFDMILPSGAGGTPTAQTYYGVCISNADFAAEGLPAGSINDSPCAAGTSWPSSGWTRPQFNFAGSFPFNTSIGVKLIETSGSGAFSAGLPYITFDNFEISNWDLYVNADTPTGQDNQQGAAFVLGGSVVNPAAGTVVENMYIHDWFSTTNYVPCTPVGMCSYQPMAYAVIQGAYIGRNNKISDAAGHYVYNGTTINSGTMGGCAGCTYFYGNTVAYGFTGCSSVFSCHDNDISQITGFGLACGTAGTTHCYNDQDAIHSHVVYEDGADQTAVYVYNNLLHDNWPGIVMGSLFYYTNVFNNVMWNNYHAGAIDMTTCEPGFACPPNTSSQVGWVANNTIDQTAGDSACFTWHATGGSGAGTVNFYNNICLPNPSIGIGGFSVATTNGTSTNHSMGSTEASTYGFTSANKYKPSSSDPAVSGAGTNLTSSCSNLVALCQDASGAWWFGGAPITRPTGSTGWDLGAFQGQGGTTGPPTLSINTPASGTVSGSQNLTATCTPQGTATCTSVQYKIDGFSFGAAETSSPYTLAWNTATAANANHVIGATATDSNGQTGTASSVTVTVSNSIPACFVSTDNDSGALSWTSNQAFTAQSANFTATVVLTPNSGGTNQDGVTALSQSPMSAYSQGAALIRFNGSTGNIDVYKGSISNYTSDNTAPFTSGTAYTFSITVNFTGPNAGTYSVSETSPSSIAIATNYAFRSTALTASLGYINAISDNTTPDTEKVCSFQVGSAASLTFSPASLNFGNVTVGASATQTITATTSGGSVNFSSVSISGNPDFTILSGGTCTGSVPSSCTTQIKFAPTSAALETATLTFTDDATGNPQTVAISGTGVPATPTLSVNPTSVNFGGVQVHTTSSSGPIVLTISSGPVTFTGTPSLSGANAADFALASNTCTGTVSAYSCQTVLSFTPSLVAAESATLTYTDNATGSPQTVALTGTGYLAPHPPTAVHATVN